MVPALPGIMRHEDIFVFSSRYLSTDNPALCLHGGVHTRHEDNHLGKRSMYRPFHLLLTALVGALISLGLAADPAKKPPAGMSQQLDDVRMAVAIKNKLARVDRRAFSSITVTVEDGVSTLTGTADTLWTQERARDLSQIIRGVRGVIDRIAVVPAEVVSDAALHEQLDRLYQKNSVVERQDIHLAVKKGIVTLKGHVQSWQEKRTALTLAKQVRGIREVRDGLSVRIAQSRPDAALRDAILQRLQFDVWVRRPAFLKVHVRDGTVLLNGQVESGYEKSRVEELAWVDGVRDVDCSGITVVWISPDPMIRSHRPHPTDRELAEAIQRVLAHDRRIAPFGLEVEVAHGEVTMKGTVPFLSIKREAEEDVHNTVGVQSVENMVTVKTDTAIRDEDIHDRILEALSHDPVLEKFPLGVVVRKGAALLTGTVDSIYERNHADNVTSRIRGVNSLLNNIVISAPEIPKTDWEIHMDLENQVWWSPFLSGQDIVATVQDGKATLKGSVDHSPQRVIAEQQAFEAGASVVDNRLQVKKRPSPEKEKRRDRHSDNEYIRHDSARP